MKTVPKITIGICCYNSEDTVERAIKSALAQDWPNFEVLIIDDGSSDNTAGVIQKTIKGDERAIFIQHETNKTFPGALNTVIAQAKGEFIAIFDDDDESAPNRISTQCKAILEYEEKSDADLVACWASRIRSYPNGYDIEQPAIGSKERGPIGTEIIDFLLYFGKKKGVFYGTGTPSCALMTRKSTYEKVGLYDINMFRSEDADFSIRLGLNGGHFIGCPEILLTQYATGGAEKKAHVVYDSYKTVMEKYKDYLVSQNRFGYAMLWNKLRLHHFGGETVKAVFVLGELFIRHPFLTWKHFWVSAPKRLIHEWKMRKGAH